ncbi:hypothetical protein R3I94_008850 [Phoxinus phoxinus]
MKLSGALLKNILKLFFKKEMLPTCPCVACWKNKSSHYKQLFWRMYSISTCLECGFEYKCCTPGYAGKGKRGKLQGIYSETFHPGFRSFHCMQISSNVLI